MAQTSRMLFTLQTEASKKKEKRSRSKKDKEKEGQIIDQSITEKDVVVGGEK